MPNNSMDSGDLGRKGERLFQELAESAKFIVNKSLTNDSAGWDFVLNDRISLSPEKFIDKRPAPLTCVVQVKAKWSDKTHFDLKLSSAEQLAKDPKPALIFCVQINRQTEDVVAAYFIHFYDKVLGKTLESLRKISSKNSKSINKLNIYYNPKAEGTEVPLNKDAFRRILYDICGPDPAVYTANKSNQLSSIGFGKHSLSIDTTIKTTEENLIKFFLGHTSELAATIDKITETRFDIPLVIHNTPQTGALSFKPVSIGACDVVMRSHDQKIASRFRGSLYLPPSSLLLTTKNPFRASCKFFEITACNNKFNIKQASMDINGERFVLGEWINFAKALIVLHAGGGSTQIRYDGKLIASGKMPANCNEKGVNAWTPRLRLLEDLKYLFDKCDASIDLKLSYDDIFKQADQIVFLYGCLRNGVPGGTIRYELEVGAPIPVGATALSNIASYMQFGDELLFWAAKLTMTVAQMEDGSIDCRSQSIDIIDAVFIHHDEYEERVRQLKSEDESCINMSKDGFGVIDRSPRLVQIDFVSDIYDKHKLLLI